jgi:hypothetical protein
MADTLNRRQTAQLDPRARLAMRSAIAPTGCVEWTGSTTSDGYGQLTVNGRHMLAHRLAWEVHNGPIPDGQIVCHTCDNRSCINVGHLWLGTQRDNVRDAMAKGRRADRTKCSDFVAA